MIYTKKEIIQECITLAHKTINIAIQQNKIHLNLNNEADLLKFQSLLELTTELILKRKYGIILTTDKNEFNS